MNKKKLVLILGILALSLTMGSFFMLQDNADDMVVYNMNPDNSKKVLPVTNQLESRDKPSFSGIIERAHLIAKVKVLKREQMLIDSGVEIKNMPKEELENIGLSDKALVTKVTMKVLKEFKGKATSNEIFIYQLGKKDDDTFGAVKLKDATSYIAFFREFEDEREANVYQAFGEEGFFKVDKNNKLMSLDTSIEYAKYDTLNEEVLIRDINRLK